jgi:serine/threonine-protein kinase
MRRDTHSAAVVVAAIGLLLAATALAQLPAAASHYVRGLELEKSGQWQDALHEFVAAARLDGRSRLRPRPGGTAAAVGYDPHFHIARCLVELGRPKDAGPELRIAYNRAVTPRDELDALRTRIEAALRERGELPRGPGEPADPAATAGRPPDAVPVLVPTAAPAEATREPSGTPAPPTAPVVPAAPTAAAVSAAVAPSPTASFQPLEIPAGTRSSRRVLLGLAALAVAAVAALWWLARRRPRPVETPTQATRVQDAPATLVDGSPALGGYEVLGTLGRGGMATTYRARRRRDGATVALKVPHAMCLDEPTFVARFLREGALGEQLHHPGIVRIHEAGEEAGRPFLAMELISGRTLKQELREAGPFPPRRALEVARGIAEALDYAHAKGVVHRDLKPDNIMILPDGGLKVMDFGIARTAGGEGLTGTNLFLGTPLYAAPEMVDPKHVDHRVDLYALGIILFEMLQGAVPFTADSPYRVIEMHMRTPLPAPAELKVAVPPAIWAIVAKLCAKDRANRYASAEALLVELNRLLRDFPQSQGGPA